MLFCTPSPSYEDRERKAVGLQRLTFNHLAGCSTHPRSSNLLWVCDPRGEGPGLLILYSLLTSWVRFPPHPPLSETLMICTVCGQYGPLGDMVIEEDIEADSPDQALEAFKEILLPKYGQHMKDNVGNHVWIKGYLAL